LRDRIFKDAKINVKFITRKIDLKENAVINNKLLKEKKISGIKEILFLFIIAT